MDRELYIEKLFRNLYIYVSELIKLILEIIFSLITFLRLMTAFLYFSTYIHPAHYLCYNYINLSESIFTRLKLTKRNGISYSAIMYKRCYDKYLKKIGFLVI